MNKAKPPSLKIDWATHAAAKYACENWHYSKCMPKNKLVKIGAWENGHFIGVILFSYSVSRHIGNPYGLSMFECCELSRIALTKHKTPVSKIIAIALKFLKKSNPGIQLIVSFADTKEGHHGGVYQATNWIYTGMTPPCKRYLDPKGKLWHARRASVHGGHGKKKVTDKWKIIDCPGKHRYLMPLNDTIKKKVLVLSKPYPKRASSVESGTSPYQGEGGGESPTDALQSIDSPSQS